MLTRGSHQSPISAAWRLVFDAANRQPALPVQAISPARICEASTASPIFLIAAIASSTFCVAHARDQQVLPDRQPDIAVAEILRDLGQPAHLIAGDFSERQRDADPVQPFLLLLVHPDMRHAVECRPRRQRLRRHAGEGLAEPLLDEREKLVVPHPVEHIFQPRLVAVGAVAEIDEDADDGIRHPGRIGRLDDDVAVFGKIPVPGDAAEPQAKPDAGLCAESHPSPRPRKTRCRWCLPARRSCRRRRRRR